MIIKGYPMGDPTSTNAIATGAGALVLLALSLLLGESHVLPVRPETWSALGYLILFGTALLFVLILFVLKRWTASATSYITVLFPSSPSAPRPCWVRAAQPRPAGRRPAGDGRGLCRGYSPGQPADAGTARRAEA